jgi:hypothetical protein
MDAAGEDMLTYNVQVSEPSHRCSGAQMRFQLAASWLVQLAVLIGLLRSLSLVTKVLL